MSTVLAGKAPFKTLFGYALMKAQNSREMCPRSSAILRQAW